MKSRKITKAKTDVTVLRILKHVNGNKPEYLSRVILLIRNQYEFETSTNINSAIIVESYGKVFFRKIMAGAGLVEGVGFTFEKTTMIDPGEVLLKEEAKND